MRSIRNLLVFGPSAPSIVLAVLFSSVGVIAQTDADALQKVHSVSGIVRSKENGQPIAGARGRILRREDTFVVLPAKPRTRPKPEYLFTTDKNGKWSVNLLDGSYVIEVTPGSTDHNQRSSESFATKKQMITVAGASDVENILIEVSKGARMSGTVIVEGALPLSSLSLHAGKVDAPIELTQGVSNSLTLTGPTTVFTMTGIPEGKIELYVFFDTDSHYVKSMSAAGLDLLQEKLDLVSGAEIKDVRIVISSELAEFTGQVLSENGTPRPGVRISLNRVGTGRVIGGRLTRRNDEAGFFLLRPPPGDYTIELHHDRREGGFLQQIKSLPKVTFKPGEQKNMEIRVPND